MNDKPEPFDPSTGEIVEPQRALDGRLIPFASTTAGNFIDMLEEGRFSGELHERMKELGTQLREQAQALRRDVKGEVVVKLKMSSDGEKFSIEPVMTIKAPEMPRIKSVAWQDEQGRFSRFPVGQGQFFGVRDVSETRNVRTVD